MMEEIGHFLKVRGNLINLFILGIVMLSIPLGINLVKQSQVYFSRAESEFISVTEGKCVVESNSKKSLKCADVPLKLISPFGPNANNSPEPSSPGSSSTPSPLPGACNSSLKTASGQSIINAKNFPTIQAALDCFKNPDSGGGAVYVPSGTYTVTEKIRIFSNVTFFGDGIDKTIFQLDSSLLTDPDGILGNDTNYGHKNITIRDMTFRGLNKESGVLNCCPGIKLRQLDGGFLYNIKVEGFSWHGIWLAYKKQTTGNLDAVEHVRISNCQILNNKGSGIEIDSPQSNNVVDHCTLSGNNHGTGGDKNGGAAINLFMDEDGLVTKNKILNNTVTGNSSKGISLVARNNITAIKTTRILNNAVCNNTVENNLKEGISDGNSEENKYIANKINNNNDKKDGKVQNGSLAYWDFSVLNWFTTPPDSSLNMLEDESPGATNPDCTIPSQLQNLPPTLPLPPYQQGTTPSPAGSTQNQASCQSSDNLFQNCGFENPLKTVTAFQSQDILGGWINTSQLKPNQFSPDLHLTNSEGVHSGSNSIFIGDLNNTICTNPKIYNGGDANSTKYSLFPEVRQYIDLNGKNSLNIEFYFEMLSAATTQNSAPFYVYIANETPPYPGKEIFLAFSDQNNSSCSDENLSDSYKCVVNGGNQQDCGNLKNTWKKVNINLSSNDLKNIGIDQKLVYIGFGVTNNYPTGVFLDDVKVTASQSSAQGGSLSFTEPKRAVLAANTNASQLGKKCKSDNDCKNSDLTCTNKKCVLKANPSPSATASVSPSPATTSSPAPSAEEVKTSDYRLADSEAKLENTPFVPFTDDPLIVNFTLSDESPGAKQIWVEFKTNDGQLRKEHLTITLLEKEPSFDDVSCNLDNISRQNLKVILKGSRFGSITGKLSASGTAMDILEWNRDSVTGIIKKPSLPTDDTQVFKIKMTRSDSIESDEIPCRIDTSLITLGAKVFCRDEGNFDVNDVKVTIIDSDNNKAEETVTIDPDGIINGLKTKLQSGKKYAISIKAPHSLRRNAIFSAGSGTTIVEGEDGEEFILPIGDIAPSSSPDGAINAADKALLTQQWIASKEGVKDLSGDFNLDDRVNSFDWACMRYDFNSEDDPLPQVPTDEAPE